MRKRAAGAWIKVVVGLSVLISWGILSTHTNPLIAQQAATPVPVPTAAPVPLAPAAAPLPIAPAPQFTGVDLLLIIDQSGSMGGRAFGGDAVLYGESGNDPALVRFRGAEYVLEWLNAYRGQLGDLAPRVNVAQITFGGVVRPLLDWTAIAPTGTTPSAWAAALDQMREAVSVQRFGPINLGYTDFQAALAEARAMFQRAPAPPTGEQNRRAVLLLTDGAPCVPTPAVQFPNCGDLQAIGAEQHLIELAADLQIWFTPAEYEIYAVGLASATLFWDQLESRWIDIACLGDPATCDEAVQVSTADTAAGVGSQFNTILAHMFRGVGNLTQESIQCAGTSCPFTVPPYVQFVRISIFKNDAVPLTGVELSNPAGTVVPNNLLGSGSPIQTHTIDDVNALVPGIWTLTLPAAAPVQGIELVSDALSARGNLLAPAAGTTGQQFVPLPVTAQIVNVAGAPLPLYQDAAGAPLYPLTVTLQFFDNAPDRADRQPVGSPAVMVLDPNQPGINQYIGELLIDQPGTYEIRMAASYTAADGTTVPLIAGQTLRDNVTIAPSQITWPGLSSPSERAGRPVSLTAELRDPAGAPLPGLEQYQLEISVLAADGTPILPAALYPNTLTTPDAITAALPPIDQPGTHTVTAQLGRVTPANVFVPVGQPQTFTLEIRPIQQLTLTIVEPSAAAMEAQAIIPRWPVIEDVPVPVQVELRDEAGALVSLATVSNGSEGVPTLTVRQNGQAVPLNTTLREAQPGIYVSNLSGFGVLGMGPYEFGVSAATPNDALTGDYQWAANLDAHTLRRDLNPWVLVLVVGTVLAIAALVIGLIVARQQRIAASTAPLRGTLALEIRNAQGIFESTVTTITFPGDRNRYHSKKFAAPLKALTVSTRGDEKTAQDSKVWVERIEFTGPVRLLKQGDFLVSPGAAVAVASDDSTGLVYYLIKDGELDAFDGQTTDKGIFTNPAQSMY